MRAKVNHIIQFLSKKNIMCKLLLCHAFQSETTLYRWLDVKELLAWNRRDIWSVTDSNGIRTHNHLVRTRTLNHLAKLTGLAK